jgi:chromosome segregation ATPase
MMDALTPSVLSFSLLFFPWQFCSPDSSIMKFRKALASTRSDNSNVLQVIPEPGRNHQLLSTYEAEENAAAAITKKNNDGKNNTSGRIIATLTEELRVVKERKEQLAVELASSRATVLKLTRAKMRLVEKIRHVWSKLPKEEGDQYKEDDVDDATKATLLQEQLRVAVAGNETLRAELATSTAKIGQLTKDKTRLIHKIRTVSTNYNKKEPYDNAAKAADDGPACLLIERQLQALQHEYDTLSEKYHSLNKKKLNQTTNSASATAKPRQLKDHVVQLQAQLDRLHRTQELERHLLSLFRQLGHLHGYKHQLGSAIRQAELALAGHINNSIDERGPANAGGGKL